jgi:hypothetical protein
MRLMQRTRWLVGLAAFAVMTPASPRAQAQTTPPFSDPPPAAAEPTAPTNAPAVAPPQEAPPVAAPAAPTPPPAGPSLPLATPLPPPAYAPPPLPPNINGLRTAAPPPGSTRVPSDDPQADRGAIGPTAYTHPKGTFYLSDYELVLLQLGYAFTDDTQISLTFLPPLATERVLFLDVTLKSTLYRGGRVRAAALGSTSGIISRETGPIGVGRAGGVVQLCVERTCASSLSVSTNLTFAGAVVMFNSATGIYRAGRSTSLLGELDTLVPLGKDIGDLNGALAFAGVRFIGTNWGLDLLLMHLFGNQPFALPFVALTYRSVP